MYSLGALGYPIEWVNQPDPDPLAASRYSCIYWVDHLFDWNSHSCTNQRVDLQDAGAIEDFVKKKYLYWLEALSLCRGMSDGVVSMAKLEALLHVSFISNISTGRCSEDEQRNSHIDQGLDLVLARPFFTTTFYRELPVLKCTCNHQIQDHSILT